MFKALALLLTLPLFWAVSVQAQTIPVETELDKMADRLNVIPAEVLVENQRLINKKTDLKLKNSTKGQISDIVKNKQILDARIAQTKGNDAPKAVNINPDNKKAVRDYLQRDLKNYNYPK